MHIYDVVTRELIFKATVNATEIPIRIGDRITTLGVWGTAPTIAEGIPAKITFRTSKEIKAYALNNLGLPAREISMEISRNYRSVFIGSIYKTIWYEIQFDNN